MKALLQGAALSYQALFTWLNPLGYLSSRIVRPIGITVTFAAVSSYYGVSVGPILVGASLLAGAHAVIYGIALSVGNERNFGTMEFWLASPQNILAAICQRALPHLADGFISGLLTYLVCSLLYQELFVSVGAFVGLLVLALASSFGLGLLIGGLNLRVRDMFLWPNIAVLALMLFAGVLITADRLPSTLRPVTTVFPLSHLMAEVRSTPFLSDPTGMALGELAVATGWFAAGAIVVEVALRTRVRE